MVRYLKWIVLVFGSIGLLIGAFFYMQNKHDISIAWDYKNKIDYNFLSKRCPNDYIFPCLKPVMGEYFGKVSLTGIGFGMKMAFTVMDKDKDQTQYFKTKAIKDMRFSLNYLILNNMAMNQVFRNYHGFKKLYGGYLTSLEQFYGKAHRFSEDIIIGLESPDGLAKIEDPIILEKYQGELKELKDEYYNIKKESQEFINNEMAILLNEGQKE